jgi:hypothetical protein
MFRAHWRLLIIVLLLQAAFFSYQSLHHRFFLDDSGEYIQTADNILSHGTIYCGDLDQSIDPALYTKRPPAYPGFLALIRLFTERMVPVLILQGLLSLFAIMVMARLFLQEKKLDFWAAGLLFFLPAQFIYSNLIMSEILFQLLIMLMAWSAWAYFRYRKRTYMWSYQLLLVLAILVKPVMYVFVVPNLVLFFFLYGKYRRRLDMISCLIPIVFVILLAGFNQQRTGYFHVSSIRQINMVDYNIYYYTMDRFGADTADVIRSSIYDHCSGERDFTTYSRCLDHEVATIIKKDPVAYGWFHAKGMMRFFIDPGRFDIYTFFGIEKEGNRGLLYRINSDGFRGALTYLVEQPALIVLWLLLIAFLNVVKAIGFLFFLFNREVRVEFRLFLFLLIGTLSFATGPLGASRFMLPVALLILGSAVYQYHSWYRKLRKG